MRKNRSSELNPYHPVTVAAHDQWHTIIALLMMKFNQTEIEISLEEIGKLISDNPAETKVVELHDTGHSLILRLVSLEEGEKLAREAGGLVI